MEHDLEIRLDKGTESWRKYSDLAGRRFTRGCHWTLRYFQGGRPRLYFTCGHQWVCKNCDKVLVFRVDPHECPEYTPRPPGPDADVKCVDCGHRLSVHGNHRYLCVGDCECRDFHIPEVVQ